MVELGRIFSLISRNSPSTPTPAAGNGSASRPASTSRSTAGTMCAVDGPFVAFGQLGEQSAGRLAVLGSQAQRFQVHLGYWHVRKVAPAMAHAMPNCARCAILACHAMDKADRAIIAHLVENGRLTNTELADRVGLSPSPCLRRVRQLETSGVLTGYHAAVDPAAVGRGFQVLLHVETAQQDGATIGAFEAEVQRLDDVSHCRRMFGRPDYLLWIEVADLDAYERLYMKNLVNLPGVARTNSQFTMKIIKGAVGARLG